MTEAERFAERVITVGPADGANYPWPLRVNGENESWHKSKEAAQRKASWLRGKVAELCSAFHREQLVGAHSADLSEKEAKVLDDYRDFVKRSPRTPDNFAVECGMWEVRTLVSTIERLLLLIAAQRLDSGFQEGWAACEAAIKKGE